MTMDPSNYDPEQLRRAARAESGRTDSGDVAPPTPDAEAADDAEARAEQLKDLLLLESSASEEQLERPYLTRVPGKYAAEVTLFEWLNFLLEQAGVRGTLNALDYYVRVGWLDEAAAEDLRDHVRGFRDLAGGGQAGELDASDHALSLMYIARLAAMS